jgi:hypothetical protein
LVKPEMMTDSQNLVIGELIEPTPVSFGFGAPGWYILLATFFIIIMIYLLLRYRRYLKNQYRRSALQELRSLSVESPPLHTYVFSIATLLKRVAITSYGREEIASLYGLGWLDYLKEKNQGIPVFKAETETIFSRSLYQGRKAEIPEENLNELINQSINWIKKHRV